MKKHKVKTAIKSMPFRLKPAAEIEIRMNSHGIIVMNGTVQTYHKPHKNAHKISKQKKSKK